jgi:hypothetical protein
MNNFLILVLALLFTSTVAFKLMRQSNSVLSDEDKSEMMAAMASDESTARLQNPHALAHYAALEACGDAADQQACLEEMGTEMETETARFQSPHHVTTSQHHVPTAAVLASSADVSGAAEEMESEDMETVPATEVETTTARVQDEEFETDCGNLADATSEDEFMAIIECIEHEDHSVDTDRTQRD